MNFIGLLKTLEQLTRPPRLGHDVDVEDYEPVSPDGYYGYAEPDLGESICGTQHFGSKARHQCYCILAADHSNEGDCHLCGCGERFRDMWDDHYSDTPDPAEPGLTPDELVGVRGLLSDYGALINLQTSPAVVGGPVDGTAEHRAAAGEPAPSPTIVQSAPPPTVDGEGSPADSGIPPSPAGERPPHPVPREQRQGTYCEDYETDGCSVDVCPDGCYHALKFRDDAAAEWIGEAVQVISEVLAEHVFTGLRKHWCSCGDKLADDMVGDRFDWRAHIAPIIANSLAPHDK